MYIQKVHIENIKSISQFDMEFKKPAGWHVLIGDNGSGKSSIIRSIALALAGPEESLGLRADWSEWLNRNKETGTISIEVTGNNNDKRKGRGRTPDKVVVTNQLDFKRTNGNVTMKARPLAKGMEDPKKYNWGNYKGWFSVSYGPYRRFGGGNRDWEKVYYAQPKLGAHLSAFGEDVALTEALEWLVKLNYQLLESKESGLILDKIIRFINTPGFLPHNTHLESISSDGVIFKDGHGLSLSVNQLSDGFRSILSLTFELIRQLARVYGDKEVFTQNKDNSLSINLPGIVMIDEIDAHLHPSWQTRIGQWFTRYFPNMQFIVTTHSPLICRAAEKGTIWRLAAPGTNLHSGEISGLEKQKLIFGNILDAYGTEVFGRSPVRSQKSDEKLQKLGKLNMMAALGTISHEDEKERLILQQILSTDAPTGK
jgi:energy-coupling factor transporter ATP-binding protein EcfA2